MKSISNQHYDEIGNCENRYCRVIPINEYHEESLEDNSPMSPDISKDFLNFFYFVPVAIMAVLIFPAIYFLLLWNRIKSILIK